MKSLLPLLLAGLLALAGAGTAYGQQTLTWNGSQNNTWANSANWTPAVVPGPADTAIIPAGTPSPPHVLANATIANLSVAQGATLRILGNNTTGHVMLTVANGFTNDGEIELGNSASTWRGDLTVTNGTLINEGTIVSASTSPTTATNNLVAGLDNRGTLTVARELTINRPGASHLNSGVIEVTGGNLVVTQTGDTPTFANSGQIAIGTGRTLTLSGGTVLHQAGGLSATNGTLTFTGTTLVLTPDFVVEDMILNVTNTTVNGPGALGVPLGETIYLSGATINTNLTNNGTVQVIGNSSVNASSLSNHPEGAIRVLGNNTTGHVMLTVANGFTNDGEIQLGNSASTWRGDMTVTNGTLINEGHIASTSESPTPATNNLNAELDNRGTLSVERVLTITRPNAIHRNSGQIHVAGGSLTYTQSGELGSFIQTGTIVIEPTHTLALSGATVFIQGGSLVGAQPTIIDQVGILALIGTTLNLAPDFPTTNLDLALTNTVTHGPGHLIVTAGRTATLSGGAINANLENHGLVRVVSNAAINSETLVNHPDAAIRVLGNNNFGHAMLTVANGFTNFGELELGNNASTWRGDMTVANGTLINEGTIISGSAVPTPASSFLNTELDNRGALRISRMLTITKADAAHVNTGDVVLVSGGLTVSGSGASLTNAGRLLVHDDQTLTVSVPTLVNDASGVVHGRGTVHVAGTSFTNSGVFAPGLRPVFGTNLIANGDAERGPLAGENTNVVITGWSDPGPMSILPYDYVGAEQAYLASSDPGPSDRGTQYFWGGIGASSSITQTVNLSEIAMLVDLGVVAYDLSGWLGGFSVQNDQMVLTASFRDSGGEQLATATLGPVTVVDRNFETKLLFREADGVVPVGTRSVLLTLTSTRFAGTANNGFADNLALVLTHTGGVETGRTTGVLAVTGNLPMTDHSAHVELGIGGYVPGAEHDRIDVSGQAELAGGLRVDFINGFIPEDSDQFAVMTFASRQGQFPGIKVFGLPGGMQVTPVYSDTHLILVIGGTPAGPPPPTLSSPANGATQVSVTPTLVWQTSSGASSYHVQLATDAGFSTMVFDAEGIEATSVEPGELEFETVHYWRARATDGEDYSPWSQTFSFTTAPSVNTDGPPGGLPLVFAVSPSYPNPAVDYATIRVALPAGAEVRLELFDLMGRRIASTAEGIMAAGYHEIRLDLNRLTSGTYIYRLLAGGDSGAGRISVMSR